MIDPAAIETVARAMCLETDGDPDVLNCGTFMTGEPMWHFYRIAARELIAGSNAYAKFMRERTMG